MASAVEFALNLIDGASNPAAKIERSLRGLEQRFRALGATSDKQIARANRIGGLAKIFGVVGEEAEKNTGVRAVRGLLAMARGTAVSDEQAKALAAGGMKAVERATEAATVAVGAFEAAMGAAALGAAGLAAAGAFYAAKMAVFRDNTLFSLKYLVGGQAAAGKLLEDAKDIARGIGASVADVTQSIMGLVRKGFTTDQAERLSQWVADLKAMTPGAQTDAFVDEIAKFKRGGVFDASSIAALNAAGVDATQVYADLAAKFHIKGGTEEQMRRRVEAALARGQLRGGAAAKLLLDEVRKKTGGGPAGAVAKEFSDTTLEGSLGKVKNTFERLFLEVKSSPAAKQVVKLFNAIAEALEPKGGGAKILAVLNDAAAGVAKLFEGVNGATLSKTFDAIASAIRTAWPYIKALGGGVWEGLKSAVAPLRDIFGNLTGKGAQPIQVIVDAFASLGKTIGFVIGVAGEVIAVMSAVGIGINLVAGLVVGAVGGIVGAIAGPLEELPALAADVVGGLLRGFQDAWGSLVDGVVSLAKGLPQAVKDVLGIASPSKVFAEIGGYTVAGFAQGVNDNAPRAQGAMLSAVNPDLIGAARAGGGGNQASMRTGDVTVNVYSNAKDAKAIGQEAAAAVLTAVRSAHEDLAIEMGAA